MARPEGISLRVVGPSHQPPFAPDRLTCLVWWAEGAGPALWSTPASAQHRSSLTRQPAVFSPWALGPCKPQEKGRGAGLQKCLQHVSCHSFSSSQKQPPPAGPNQLAFPITEALTSPPHLPPALTSSHPALAALPASAATPVPRSTGSAPQISPCKAPSCSKPPGNANPSCCYQRG